jgi:WD40 repeat protein
LASSGEDGTARLWDLNGNQLAEFQAYQGWVTSVSFSPDGNQIATAGQDSTVKIWQIEDLDELLSKGETWIENYLNRSYAVDVRTEREAAR